MLLVRKKIRMLNSFHIGVFIGNIMIVKLQYLLIITDTEVVVISLL